MFKKKFDKAKRKVGYPGESKASQLGWHPTDSPILYRLSNT